MQTHRNNLLRVLGDSILVDAIDLSSLDDYCKKRRQEKGQRNRQISATTIRKELVTLRHVWQWGKKRNKVETDLPSIRDVKLPKTIERPPFQTYDEIVQQIEREDLSPEQQDELWECLYLRRTEIDELLQHVREQTQYSFLYPMIVTAAHTGARRSELMRSQLTDIRDDKIIIREKKRRRGKLSTRRVPFSTLLSTTLQEWRQEHPGGKFTFVNPEKPAGDAPALSPLTRDEAHYHFKHVLQDSKWDVIRGWHCLRHSFISNLASQSVDQRLIDEFVGHTTEEMRRRYRHLFPDVKQAAITNVFG